MNFKELISKANERLFIIAEAGVNHNGDLQAALRLVDAAVEAGCDAVKFQTWVTELVYSEKNSIKPDYQKLTTKDAESEFETVKKLELTHENFVEIKGYCESKGILFFSTPDEEESANFLRSINIELFKTASQDVTNTPFLKFIAKQGVPVIFSTGACTLSELTEAVEVILQETNELIILHCVSSYPAPINESNLLMIPTLKSMFKCMVGFSDHTLGSTAATAAVALGARVFEKHLTLDKSMIGPDHQASLEPSEMKDYCATLRNIYSGLGDGIKKVMPCEMNTRKAFRRYAVAARPLSKGSILKSEDIVSKKVVSGIPPKMYDLIFGSVLKKDLDNDEIIQWDSIQLK